MSFSRGPNIVRNGLVLCLDASNVKSFKGEPTTNLITTLLNYLGGSYSYSYPNSIYNPTALEINTVDGSLYGGTYSKYVGTNSNGNSQIFWQAAGTNPINEYGQTCTFSIYLKGSGTCHLAFYDNNYGYQTSDNITLTDVWTRYSLTKTFYSGTNTSHWVAVRGIITTTTVYVSGAQWERKSQSSPFVIGSRGSSVDTGGGWADLSGNNNHGSLTGTTYNSNNNGNLVFNGTSNYIVITSNTSLEPTNVSVEAIIKTISNASGAIITMTSTSGGAGHCYYLGQYDSGASIRFGIYGTSAWNTTTATISHNTWYHVVGTYDKSNMKIYLNGIYNNGTVLTEDINYSWSTILSIGRKNATDGEYFNGNIAAIKLYNRALTASEILQNYNALKSRFV